jgi:hypothetical protein
MMGFMVALAWPITVCNLARDHMHFWAKPSKSTHSIVWTSEMVMYPDASHEA